MGPGDNHDPRSRLHRNSRIPVKPGMDERHIAFQRSCKDVRRPADVMERGVELVGRHGLPAIAVPVHRLADDAALPCAEQIPGILKDLIGDEGKVRKLKRFG